MRLGYSNAAIPYANQRSSANRLLDYFKNSDPAFYRYVIADLKSTGGLSAVDSGEGGGPPKKSIFDKIIDAGTAFYSIKQQRDIMKLQTKRAEKGLPPLDTASLAPTVRVQVDSSQMTSDIGNKLRPLMIPALMALTLLLVIPRIMKK